MATWAGVEAAVPDLSAAVQAAFDAHIHKVLATLRADGSPRVSGNEALFRDGQVWFGMMHRSVKALDLLADPRLALHSATVDPEMRTGDAKLSGRAVEVTDPEVIRGFATASAAEHEGVEPPEPFHLFTVDVTEISLVRIGDPPDHLLIESWTEAGGYRRAERR